MRVGYTRRRNPLSRESGVISKSFLFSYFYIVWDLLKSQTIFSFAATQQQLVSALRIPNNFFFLSAKDCYHLVWEPGCADMVVIQSSGSMVADMIPALTQTIVKHRKMEPLNVDVWKMRMQLLLKERDLFFFILEKREARRSGANGFFNQVMLL